MIHYDFQLLKSILGIFIALRDPKFNNNYKKLTNGGIKSIYNPP